jgi:phage FluMu protein gp41
VDLLATVADYLDQQLAAELGSSPDAPKVFADDVPDVQMPYICLHDVGETYRFDSSACFVADGRLVLNVKAAGKAQARRIGLRAIRVLSDAELACEEGVVLEMRPESAASAVLVESVDGFAGPTAAERSITFHYKVQLASA